MSRRQLFFQSLTEAPQPIATVNTPVTLGWFRGFDSPELSVRRLSVAVVASGLFLTPVIPPTTSTPAPAAATNSAQPVQKRQLFYQALTQVFPPKAGVTTPTTFGWMQQPIEPHIQRGLPIAMAGFLSGNGPIATPTAQTFSGWYRQLEEPVKHKQVLTDYHVRSYVQTAPPAAPPIGWLVALGEPIKGPKVHQGLVTPVLDKTAPAGLPPIGWFVSLNEPVKGPKVHQGFVTPVLARGPSPVIAPESWYRQLSEPVRGPKVYYTVPDMPLPVLGPVATPPTPAPTQTWTISPEETSTWTPTTEPTATWTDQNPKSGTWTKGTGNTSTWTKQTPPGGGWTKK